MRTMGVVSLLLAAIVMTGCKAPIARKHNLPPAEMLAHPGPGVGGPGPGIMAPPPPGMPMQLSTSQVHFAGPEGMVIRWDVTGPGRFDSEPLVAPGRYNFPQGAIYRVKLTNIPARPGVELYPTLEVGPTMARTEAFLAHNAIPVQFTEEDFDQVLGGNFVTKVLYLPDPEFQELALAGVETLVSTRLDPGVDPIVEAARRGAIMAIVRLGNKDLAIPGGNANGGDMVSQASYQAGVNGGPCPVGASGVGRGAVMPNGFIAGVTAPQYGMPMSGTPIGLPGPPHIPLGVPAGLQSHTIVNHTKVKMPEPVRDMRMDVIQFPGYSYPQPPNHVWVKEWSPQGIGAFRQPHGDKRAIMRAGCPGGECPTGSCPADGSGGDCEGN